MSKPETVFVRSFVDAVKRLPGSNYVHKHHGGQYSAGLPDLFVCSGEGLFLEVKAIPELPFYDESIGILWKKSFTALQVDTLVRMWKAGQCGGGLVYCAPTKSVCLVAAPTLAVITNSNLMTTAGEIRDGSWGITAGPWVRVSPWNGKRTPDEVLLELLQWLPKHKEQLRGR